ncbi:MAG: tectonin domain-containing protein [Nostoc sp.]|uniref:tectonin domain-containing protein n=1 Tax=Nostoc sp. TaxID=1180 RepID=UPI002FFCFA50
MKKTSVGVGGAVWGINSSNQIYRFNNSTQRFQQIQGVLTQISVGADGTVWGINPSNQIYRFNRLSALHRVICVDFP